MKPVLSYYGGKQTIANTLLELFPPHTGYVEPFCGGATMLFKKPQSHSDFEVLNDLNDWIITLYRVMQDEAQSARLLRMLDWTPHSHAEHRRAKDILKNGCDDDVKTAWAVWVQCNMSFANDMFKGWRFSFDGQEPVKTKNLKDALPQQVERIKHVYLESVDAVACIQKWDRPGMLFYCDPPYPGADQGHYKGYTQADFERLIQAIDTAQGSFVLSCYANEAVPTHWHKVEIVKNCDARKGKDGAKRQTRTECVWIVDRSEGHQGHGQKRLALI
jgi:DNA adenine methylase